MTTPISPALIWSPSPEAIVAARAATSGHYDQPPAWDAGAHCAGGLQPGTRALGDAVQARWPAFLLAGRAGVGGYNCRPNTAAEGTTSLHGMGRAADLMMAPTTQGNVSRAADVIADWLLMHARELGLEEVIWSWMIWSSSRGLRPYNGPNAHHDHIHVGLSPASAAHLPTISPDSATSGGESGTTSGHSVGAVIAGTAAGVGIAVGLVKLAQAFAGRR